VYFQEISVWRPGDEFLNAADSVVNAFPVGVAGTYAFYVNSMMYGGQGAGDAVSEASCVVIFYPRADRHPRRGEPAGAPSS